MDPQPIVPDHVTQYEENASSNHGEMHKDGQTDRSRQTDGWTGPFPIFPQFHLGGVGNNTPSNLTEAVMTAKPLQVAHTIFFERGLNTPTPSMFTFLNK